jgi:lysophospholipase L1-like esterase
MDWVTIRETEAGRTRDDWIGVELVPSQRILFRGAILTTNQWGMRDREYTREKPAETFRFATLGASTTMGWSVGDDESYEALTEDRLNREGIPGIPYQSFESLNFSVPGYITHQFLAQLDYVFTFQPDAVFFTAQDNDVERLVGRLLDQTAAGVDIPFDTLVTMARSALDGTSSRTEAEQRLRQRGAEMIGWLYAEAARRTRDAGAVPVWVYLPQLERVRPVPRDKEIMFQAARDAGFAIIDLSGVFDDEEREELIISEFDFHPSVLGHRLVADLFYQRLTEQPEIFEPGSERP